MTAKMAHCLTIAEAARRAEMHPNNLRYWMRRGAVETVQTPLGRVVVRDSLEEFVKLRADQRHATTRSE